MERRQMMGTVGSRLALLVAALVLSWSMTTTARAGELHVYAGAGLREPVEKLAESFRQETGTTLAIEYGGSGQLLARIKETGHGDLFIPGSLMYFEGLKKDGALMSTFPLAEHGAVLAVNKASADKIKTFADLAKPGIRIGLGDAQAMALGRTAEEILDHSSAKDAILANVTVRATTVKQLTLYVTGGDVDAAIIGGPDAARNTDTLVTVAIPEGTYQPEIIGVAVLKASQQPQEAQKFAEFLASERGKAVFTSAGFPAVHH